MDRVCINKTTGKIIEMQSGGYDDEALRASRLDTLRQNAINAGYAEGEIEVKWVTGEELAALIAANYVPPRIEFLTNRQAKRQLVAMGLYEQIEAAVLAMGLTAKIDWECASGFKRDDPTFLAIKAGLGLTDEQEETFFSEGSLL